MGVGKIWYVLPCHLHALWDSWLQNSSKCQGLVCHVYHAHIFLKAISTSHSHSKVLSTWLITINWGLNIRIVYISTPRSTWRTEKSAAIHCADFFLPQCKNKNATRKKRRSSTIIPQIRTIFVENIRVKRPATIQLLLVSRLCHVTHQTLFSSCKAKRCKYNEFAVIGKEQRHVCAIRKSYHAETKWTYWTIAASYAAIMRNYVAILFQITP